MAARGASRTAVLVCQGRAVAHGRIAPDRFADPAAMELLRPQERIAVESARGGVAPQGWTDRMDFESMNAMAEVIAPRTVAIDDAVRDRLHPQLVILGAGLDGRAWRMPELAATDVYEVDHPASQQDKRDRCGTLRPLARSVRFVPVDLSREPLGPALAAAGHDAAQATTWIWEGVVPYLDRAEVRATAAVIAERSAPGSRLILNYQSPSAAAWFGRLVARAMAIAARRPDPFAREPRRSAWKPGAMRALLAAAGLPVSSDDDLLTLARRLHTPARHTLSLRNGRVAVADRAATSTA
ncbi:class I SAM-dependent methyltransferase [Actinoplanes sp. NPDC026623]|uniref:class I SAM-dependent methyltransferase n=1 Tax=Actinoplanes sp. NPDC026623 TaxID=3155610 RepID=UPI0033F9E4A6